MMQQPYRGVSPTSTMERLNGWGARLRYGGKSGDAPDSVEVGAKQALRLIMLTVVA